jgi:hypothetical protein
MINNWSKFNESKSEQFTEEMAQEILYYFSEDSKPDKEIYKMFWRDQEEIIDSEGFVMYETGYDEMNGYIKKLYDLVNTESLTFRDDMIEIYNKIREERSSFPLICKIEDIFLRIIENEDFSFFVHSTDKEYEITLSNMLSSNIKDIDRFIYLTKEVENCSTRLKSSLCDYRIRECRFENYGNEKCLFYI